VDAICINQADEREKGEQIRRMVEIYSNASCVIVWLGEADGWGDQALKAMGLAATAAAGSHSDSQRQPAGTKMKDTTTTTTCTITQVSTLIQRRWFQRIWVLQEVAAAREVLIKCGPAEISGLAFWLGLESLSRSGHGDISRLRDSIRPVADLIKGGGFRRQGMSVSGRFTLGIRPLGELVDMYRTHQATDRRDKIFALLGMSSDHQIFPAVMPNYKTPWAQLLRDLVRYFLGDQVEVATASHAEVAVVKGQASVLGRIKSVSGNKKNMQSVALYLRNERVEVMWMLPPLAQRAQKGDLVCLISGATRPCILRPCRDYFAVVMITAPSLPQPQNPSPAARPMRAAGAR
jgi:hypothetical protein